MIDHSSYFYRTVIVAVAAGTAVLLSSCSPTTPVAIAAPETVTAVASTVTAPETVTATASTVTAAGRTITVQTTVSLPPRTVLETVTETAEAPPSTENTDTSIPTGLTVGGPGITATNDDGGAKITVLSVHRKATGTGDYGEPPKNGNYVLIDVTYECTTGTFDYNPFDWNVRDADGRTYDSSGAFSSGYSDAALDSGTLGKGSKARGTLVFDAPKGSLTLEYSAGLNNAPASWSIPA